MSYLDNTVNLYHACRNQTYAYPDWENRLRSNTDFGLKIYFSLEYNEAVEYATDRGTSGNIAVIEVPYQIFTNDYYNGLKIINYGYPNYSNEFYSAMGYYDEINWTSQVLANRFNFIHLLNNDEFANIMIGPRVDDSLNHLYNLKYDINENTFNDHGFLREAFQKMKPDYLPLQIAFDQLAFDTLIGEFTNDIWTS